MWHLDQHCDFFSNNFKSLTEMMLNACLFRRAKRKECEKRKKTEQRERERRSIRYPYHLHSSNDLSQELSIFCNHTQVFIKWLNPTSHVSALQLKDQLYLNIYPYCHSWFTSMQSVRLSAGTSEAGSFQKRGGYLVYLHLIYYSAVAVSLPKQLNGCKHQVNNF